MGPCALAFIASASIMIVELLAFRLVARYLGNSNYTVTSIIGVILGGLAIGNFVGGMLADRFHLGRTLAVLFMLCSIGCFAVPILNKQIGDWTVLWFLTWPRRIAIHVMLTFSLPAMLLGTIGPIVAKMALLRTTHIGRTVGIVYAFGALGSIVGTFACGFYLIPEFGNYAVIQAIGTLLAIVALVSAGAYWFTVTWAAAVIVILCVGLGPWPWARALGSEIGIRENITPDVLFDADSEYSHVRVEKSHDRPSKRTLILDKLEHSYIDIRRPEILQYGYEQVYAAIGEYLAGKKETIRALVLGGGGYTNPRYILRRWPRAYVEVVEIDPVVTQAARETFGLTDDPRMKIVHLDARQHVADVLRRKKAGEHIEPFDFIFLDAVNDFNVPFHLTTRECQEMFASLLTDDGVFMMNLIDLYDVGQFLGATINTMKQTFPFVEVFYAGAEKEPFRTNARYTFVVVGSRHDLHLENLDAPDVMSARSFADNHQKKFLEQRLSKTQVDELLKRANGLVITDDHAPVEALLAGVVQRFGKDTIFKEAALRFYNRGNSESALGQYERAVASYKRAIEIEPALNLAYLNMGLAYIELKNWGAAEDAFNHAAKLQPDAPGPYLNLGGLYMYVRKYDVAESSYRRALQCDPEDAHSWNGLGMALGNQGRLGESKKAFEQALKIEPEYKSAQDNLQRVNQAIKQSGASASQPS